MRRAWMRIVMNFILLLALALVIVQLAGCANTMRTPEPLVDGENREFITLRTGQICEVKDTKIVACERNTYRYAENKADLRQMDALAESEENKNEN